MHIPDGFLDTKTIVATGALSACGAGKALYDIRRTLEPRNVPVMGLAAAFVFVAQMINFPIAGGTSGHLIGATLLAILLGPAAAILVVAVVLSVQCLLFADGGVIALGANIFNMGIVGTVTGYYVYRLIRAVSPARYGEIAGAAFGAWCSTVAAAICCTGELAWSGIVPWNVAFPAMTGVHILIGFGESIITVLVLAAVAATRPDLFSTNRQNAVPASRLLVSSMVLYGTIILAGFNPDIVLDSVKLVIEESLNGTCRHIGVIDVVRLDIINAVLKRCFIVYCVRIIV